MSLATVEPGASAKLGAPDIPPASHKWQDWPMSKIAHHGAACCDIAREWMLAMDMAQTAGATTAGPRWLRQRYPWGPSPWPLHWCEAVGRERLDCGAHAAIAQEFFTARGVDSRPAQFVQQYSTEATLQWADKWQGEGIAAAWINGDLIYHEGCAVLAEDGELKLWDASAGWWISPDQSGGYGSLRSCRVSGSEGESFSWGTRQIMANTWTDM